MRKLLLAAFTLGVVASVVGAVTALAAPEGHVPVTLCHRTGSVDGGNQHNGYDIITVDIASAGQASGAHGHDGHEQVGNGPGPDIIPAYSWTYPNGPHEGETINYPGKGLDWVFDDGTTGAEFLANGCQLPEDTPTETPPPTTPPPTTPPPTTPPPTTPPPTSPPPTSTTPPPWSPSWTPSWTPPGGPIHGVPQPDLTDPLPLTGGNVSKPVGAIGVLLVLSLGAHLVRKRWLAPAE